MAKRERNMAINVEDDRRAEGQPTTYNYDDLMALKKELNDHIVPTCIHYYNELKWYFFKVAILLTLVGIIYTQITGDEEKDKLNATFTDTQIAACNRELPRYSFKRLERGSDCTFTFTTQMCKQICQTINEIQDIKLEQMLWIILPIVGLLTSVCLFNLSLIDPDNNTPVRDIFQRAAFHNTFSATTPTLLNELRKTNANATADTIKDKTPEELISLVNQCIKQTREYKNECCCVKPFVLSPC